MDAEILVRFQMELCFTLTNLNMNPKMTSPVIETNIELILSDHLPAEVNGINHRIKELEDQIEALTERKAKLLRIAHAAQIHLEDIE